jgi:hypothetical protein
MRDHVGAHAILPIISRFCSISILGGERTVVALVTKSGDALKLYFE